MIAVLDEKEKEKAPDELLKRARAEACRRAHVKSWKRRKAENHDDDLEERLRQFGVVCRVAFQLRRNGATIGGRNKPSLREIGTGKFGLTDNQSHYCSGRARNLLDEIHDLVRVRGRMGLPVDSDAAIALIENKKVA